MANPLMGMMGGGAPMGGGMPQINNPMQMFQQFQKFRQEMRNTNARDKMQELVKSGKCTQEQVDQAMQMAQQMQGMFKGHFK